MTSSWFSGFYDACLKDRPGMLELVNFTQYYVSGATLCVLFSFRFVSNCVLFFCVTSSLRDASCVSDATNANLKVVQLSPV